MKQIACGTSKLLWLQLTHGQLHHWEYVIDDFTDADDFYGLPVRRSDSLRSETDFKITIFAVSNSSIVAILRRLACMGLNYGHEVQLYSDLFASDFANSLHAQLNWNADPSLLTYATSSTLNSRAPVHTTICGTWLVLESLRRSVTGDVAEVGAYEGGNALCALQSPIWNRERRYFLFDSLEGFPDLTRHDPTTISSGDYATTRTAGEIIGQFAMHKNATFIKGFIPGTFSQIQKDARFSTVFYDCDLYQPALDTYEFFWDKLSAGGVILIHDYYAPPGGFKGVKKATDEFCQMKNIRLASFWHNTMAVILKP